MSSNQPPVFSMTGFGAGTAEESGLAARVEIRAVNHRGLKLSVRSRPSLSVLEKELQALLRERLSRGAVNVSVQLSRPVDSANLPIREDLARGVVSALRHLRTQLSLDGEVGVSDLVCVPGLFDEGFDAPVAREEWPVIERAVRQAIDQVRAMRETEGAATVARLRELVQPIASFAQEARGLAPLVVERARERLTARVREVAAGAPAAGDQQAIEREICLIADKADINEELDRLGSHLAQFEDLFGRGGEIGKRLEFLAQEFLREVNTAASKANDTEIITRALDAKAAIEKIKEQVANIE